MKRFLFIFLILHSVWTVRSQDIIFMDSGETIKAYGVEVAGNAIYYRLSADENGAIQRIAKSEVLMIKREDGSVISLIETTPSQTSVVTQKDSPAKDVQPQKKADPNEYLNHEYNKKMIERLNNPAKTVFEDGTKKAKKAKRVLIQHGATEDSQFASNDVIVSYEFDNEYVATTIGKVRSFYSWNGRDYAYIPMVYINIENITDKTTFVDLANTFLIRNGESQPYYSSSPGGGDIGASGGAKSEGSAFTTSTSYNQRVVAIPPRSSHRLKGRVFLSREANDKNYFKYRISYSPSLGLSKSYAPLKTGEDTKWDISNTPNKVSCFLTYSFGEDLTEIYTLNSTLYIMRAVGGDSYYTPFYTSSDPHIGRGITKQDSELGISMIPFFITK